MLYAVGSRVLLLNGHPYLLLLQGLIVITTRHEFIPVHLAQSRYLSLLVNVLLQRAPDLFD